MKPAKGSLTLRVLSGGRRVIGHRRALKIGVRVVRAGQLKAVTTALTLRR